MIYRRQLLSAINANSFTVFVVLLAITLSVIAVRVLDNAAWGKIDEHYVVLYLLLSFFNASPYLVQLTAIMGILQTFQRLYADSEMVIWEAAGMPLFRWIQPIGRWLLGLCLLAAFLVMVVRPWSIGVSRNLDNQYQQGQTLLKTSPGVFHPLGDARSVIYVEDGQSQGAPLRHVFIYRETPAAIRAPSSPPEVQMSIAAEGSMMGSQTSLMQLKNGLFYHLQWQPWSMSLMHFNTMELDTLNPYKTQPEKAQSTPMWTLMLDQGLASKAELFWRISIIMQTLIMGLFALALSYSAPRKRSYMSYLVLLAAGIIYFNLLSVMQNLIIQARITPMVAFALVHGTFALIGTAMVYSRAYRFSWRRWLPGFRHPLRAQPLTLPPTPPPQA